jgi:hypothetical protein
VAAIKESGIEILWDNAYFSINFTDNFDMLDSIDKTFKDSKSFKIIFNSFLFLAPNKSSAQVTSEIAI